MKSGYDLQKWFWRNIRDNSGFTPLNAMIMAGVGAVLMAMILNLMNILLKTSKGNQIKAQANNMVGVIATNLRDEKVCTLNFIGRKINTSLDLPTLVDLSGRTVMQVGSGNGLIIVASAAISHHRTLAATEAKGNEISHYAELRVEITKDTSVSQDKQGIGFSKIERKIPLTFTADLGGNIIKCSGSNQPSDACTALGGSSHVDEAFYNGSSLTGGKEHCIFNKLAITDNRAYGVAPANTLQVKGDFRLGANNTDSIAVELTKDIADGKSPVLASDDGSGNGLQVCFRKDASNAIGCPNFSWKRPYHGIESPRNSNAKTCSVADYIVCEQQLEWDRFDTLEMTLGTFSATPTGGTTVTLSHRCCHGKVK